MTPVYRLNKGAAHLFTASTVERDKLVSEGWTNEGLSWYAPDIGVSVRRMHNPYSGDYMLVSSNYERNMLRTAGWSDEGDLIKSGSDIPVFRLYNPNNGMHMFTPSEAERDNLVNNKWKLESICMYAAAV